MFSQSGVMHAESEFLEEDAEGSAGALLTARNTKFFKLEASCCNRNLILVKECCATKKKC